MIKGIVLTILVVFGLFDILLIMGCAKLEKKQEEQKKEYPPCYASLRGSAGL